LNVPPPEPNEKVRPDVREPLLQGAAIEARHAAAAEIVVRRDRQRAALMAVPPV
jgi:hypothetical protein